MGLSIYEERIQFIFNDASNSITFGSCVIFMNHVGILLYCNDRLCSRAQRHVLFGGGHSCLRALHLPTVLTVLIVSHVSKQTYIKITYRDFLQPEICNQEYKHNNVFVIQYQLHVSAIIKPPSGWLQKRGGREYSLFLNCCSQPDDGYILAETRSWFCIINKFLCLGWIYCASGYTESTQGINWL
jgi:hypothetical protein